MKLLAWMPIACILFLRSMPSKGRIFGRNIVAPNNEAINFEGHPEDNMAMASASVLIPEQEPPELIVILKKEAGDGKGLQDEVNLKFRKDMEATEVGDDDGMSITCSADYPISLEIQLNDGYFTYFFKPAGKSCKCEQVACSHCFKLGIRFPMKVWNSLKETRLTFTCRSISGRALMQKKAMLTRSGNSTHNVEILTTSTEKLETAIKPPTSSGRASVRIGNCQLDSHGDDPFITEASGKIPACSGELKMDKETKPCLKEVNPAQLTGTVDNSFVDANPSPFLDMDVLERMICNFGSTSLRGGNTGKSDYNGDYGGNTNQTVTERPWSCWFICLSIILICILILMVSMMCWVSCIRPWYRERESRRVFEKIRAQRAEHQCFRHQCTNMTADLPNVSNIINSIIELDMKLREVTEPPPNRWA